jgi:hypothetical protein
VPLPETIPTKISSEAAGYISLTPVERREIPAAELISRILALTGKNPVRIREILERGSLVSGPARYRWQGIDVSELELAAFLDRFPDPEPERPFDAAKCRLVVLRSQRGNLELPREAASERRFLKRRSFWDELLPVLREQSPRYERYSYSEQADVYVVRLGHEALQNLRSHAVLLKYSTLEQQLQFVEADSAEIFVER